MPISVTVPNWPADEAFTVVRGVTHEGDGATCRRIAVCDVVGQPCQVFEMGADALFFAEFVIHADLEVPSAGVEVLNERNIIVHGKNSIQTRAAVAPAVASRQRASHAPAHATRCGSAATYTFNVGLASLPAGCTRTRRLDALRCARRSRSGRVVVVNGAGVFTVVPPRSGHSLPYHGLCDLDGDVAITTEDPHDA